MVGRVSDVEFITGVHAVAEALNASEPVKRLHVGERRQSDPAVRTLVAAARAAGVPIDFEPDAFFRRFGDVRHQQVVATAERFRYAEFRAVRAAVRVDDNALVVVMDHIEDPHNLGAVIRNAEGAGAIAAIIAQRRAAPVTPAARRAAAGAASHLRVCAVPNLARTLDDLKADGCWVYGLATAKNAVPYTQIDYRGRCAIVVGAEGKGLSRLVLERCDRLALIPLAGKVASLNASSAVAIALFEAVRQRSLGTMLTPKTTSPAAVNP